MDFIVWIPEIGESGISNGGKPAWMLWKYWNFLWDYKKRWKLDKTMYNCCADFKSYVKDHFEEV